MLRVCTLFLSGNWGKLGCDGLRGKMLATKTCCKPIVPVFIRDCSWEYGHVVRIVNVATDSITHRL